MGYNDVEAIRKAMRISKNEIEKAKEILDSISNRITEKKFGNFITEEEKESKKTTEKNLASDLKSQYNDNNNSEFFDNPW